MFPRMSLSILEHIPRLNSRMIPHIAFLLFAVVVTAEYIPPGPRYRCPENGVMLYPCKCTKESDQGLNIHCENSNLAAMAVGLANVAALRAPIEELVLYECNIGRLHGPMLYPLRVRILKIINTPLKIIDQYAFLGINRTMQELHILNSQLEHFPVEAFQILGNISMLRIDNHNMKKLPQNAFSAGLLPNRLEKVHITNGLITDIPADIFVPLRKLKKLDLHGNRITQLRKNQFKGLRDTEVLDLSHNNITKIDASQIADLAKMGWCNLSHNALTELTRGAFARNAVLKVLNLNHNKIKKLDANTFRGMRFIRHLFMSDNNITDVGRGTFGSVPKIGVIDLARNSIKKIDYQMFQQLQYVEVIDVSENKVKVIEKLSFKDLYLVKINISHNEIEKIEPGAFEQCSNISLLDLSHNKIQYIPSKAFDSASYAIHFNLAYNQLTNLSQVPLQNMTGLKILNVSYNMMESIPRNSFPKLYELHTVDLSHNQITEIWNSVFQTLFSLRYLNLSYNSLQAIKGSTFGALHTLLELDISNNNISDVNRASLSRLASTRILKLNNNKIPKIFQLPISLAHLDLSNNSIESITPLTTWPSMNSLLSLDLSHNKLGDSLESGAFANLLTLQKVDLSFNNISKPPFEALSGLTTLQYLNLKNNEIKSLGRGAFGRLPVVFDLNLAHNKLNNISKNAFEGLLQLLTLNFTANNLTHIPNGAFLGLVSLRTLDLSHNYLEKLDNKTHGLLDDCLSLERVNLSNNKISTITRKTFPSNPWIPYRLQEIDLSFNTMPVLSYDITFGTKKLLVLNVSHNLINEIRINALGNLTALKVLDLSHNELTDLPGNVFGPPRNLTSLYLSYNKLRKLPVKQISSLKAQLLHIDARNNEISEFPYELMPLIKNGTDLLFSGNPLSCNCLVRPLKHWMASQLYVKQHWKDIHCAQPEYLFNQSLSSVSEDKMTCDSEREYKTDPAFDVNPDIKFRNVKKNEKGDLSLAWYVSSTEDIGDFHLLMRDLPNMQSNESSNQHLLVQNLFEKDLSYITRSYVVKDLPKRHGDLQMCLLARDSEGNIRKWRMSQCERIPMDNSFSASSVALPLPSSMTLLLFAVYAIFRFY